MKQVFKCLLLCLPITLAAQKNSTVYEVRYDQFRNGEKGEQPLSILYYDQTVFLSKANDKIQHYSDLRNQQNITTIQYEGNVFKTHTSFEDLPKPSLEKKPKTILGYSCQYASFSYFSNKIEVWYTEATKSKGSPYSRFLPSPKALVMEIVVNGDKRLSANTVDEVKDYLPSNNFKKGATEVSKAEFEEIKINARYHKVQVFKNEKINFDTKLKPNQEAELQSNQTYHFSNGSVVLKKIKLTEKLKKSGYVFARLHCKSNGDAYDRTGSVFILPVKKDADAISLLDAYQHGVKKLPIYKDNSNNEYQGIIKESGYAPPIEIIRFFTSFGANHFNEKRAIHHYDWAEDVVYEQEITALMPLNEDEIWVGVFIGNYDAGGHIISLDLDFHPSFGSEGDKEYQPYIEPLFSTVNTLEMSGQNYGKLFNNDTLKVTFELTEDVENLRLLYTSTGHGGWGNGDEFNPKLNQLFIDGKEIFKVVPWRTDCASYRLANPASGNFQNGLSSSDLSRSNWCPATLTPPYIIPLSDLKQGKHVLEVVIDQGKDEGSSFNHWGVSGTLVGKVLLSKDVPPKK